MNLAAIKPVETQQERWNKLCDRLHYIPASRRVEITKRIRQLQEELGGHREPNEQSSEELVLVWSLGDEEKSSAVRECRAKGMSYRAILSRIEALAGDIDEDANDVSDLQEPDRESLEIWEEKVAREERDKGLSSDVPSGDLQYGIPEPWPID